MLDECFGDRYERTMKQIATMFCLRMMAISVTVFDIARILGNCGVLGIISSSIVNQAIILAKSGCLSSIQLLVGYRFVILCYLQVIDKVILMCTMIISLIFWVLVISWWIIVNRYGQVPFLIYFIIASFSIVFTVGFVLLLFVAAKIGDDVFNLVTKVRYKTKMDYLTNFTLRKWRKVILLTAKATRPVRLVYS